LSFFNLQTPSFFLKRGKTGGEFLNKFTHLSRLIFTKVLNVRYRGLNAGGYPMNALKIVGRVELMSKKRTVIRDTIYNGERFSSGN
jgi:hypothetical protein